MALETCLRIATRTDGDAIGTLRVSEYHTAPEFQNVDQHWLKNLLWTTDDDHAAVLGVWDSGRLIATMRSEIIRDRRDASRQFDDAPVPHDHTIWPCPVLTRAATCESRHGSGLNSLMRLHFINACLRASVRRLYGYVALGGARTRLMTKLGYEFQIRSDPDPFHPSELPWAVAWLDLQTRGANAVQMLTHMTKIEAERYPWVGPEVRIPEG